MRKFKISGSMGFRVQYIFNLTLLVKQVWRVLTNPDAPWVRLLKDTCFRTCNFINVKF